MCDKGRDKVDHLTEALQLLTKLKGRGYDEVNEDITETYNELMRELGTELQRELRDE